MRVAVTGSTGLLGRHILDQQPAGTEILAFSRQTIHIANSEFIEFACANLLDTSKVTEIFDSWKPDVIIHAAAEGSVDAVEGNVNKFRPLNVEVPRELALWAANNNSQFVFVSSNAVYGGRQDAYDDYDPVDPINDYGRLKVEAETAVLSQLPSAFIPRPILMYGWPSPTGRNNPVSWWVNSLRAGHEIRVVDDTFSEPIAAWDAASAIWAGIACRTSGPVNLSSGVSTSLYEFAKESARAFGLNEALILPISSESLVGIAPRPRMTQFNGRRMKNELKIEPMSPEQGLIQLKQKERFG